MNSSALIKLPVQLNGTRVRAMLDSGAQGNFISRKAIDKAGPCQIKRRKPYALHVANGQPMPGTPLITEQTTVHLEIQGHEEMITLDVLTEASHEIILGLPWLRKHNPHIDWDSNRLSLERCKCALQTIPTHRQSSVVDERVINSMISRHRSRKPGRTLADAGRNHQVTERKMMEDSTIHEIPDCYRAWNHMFTEREGKANLPEHQPWDHTIDLEEGKTPPFGPLYGKSGKELEQEKEFVDTNLEKGYIRPSKSSAASPFMFVPKKDGTPRPCVDYRKLNDITKKNRYPLPNIAELRDRLSRAKIFTTMDLRDGYHLIRMKKGEEWKTAFRTRYGLFEYTVMPFGLTNAPATFQALVNNVLRNYLDIFVIAYMDDILVYSENETDHVAHVQTVLRALDKAHLRVKPKKCKFHVKRLEFLGHVISTDGIEMAPDKIECIRNWPVPKTAKNIQEFLGFCGFNRQFVKDYSEITIPLIELTKKDVPFRWTEACGMSFQLLKIACITPPALIHFRDGEPLRFETDASDRAIGACAKQERNGKWHPIAYYSYKFNDTETRYDVHDKELYAIVKALKHWRIYALSCSSLEIYTDHKNLLRFTTTKELTPRQQRWSQTTGQYKFKIIHVAGKENGRADALSRRSDLAGEKAKTYSAILRQTKEGHLEPTAELNQLLVVTREVPKEQQEEIIQQYHDDPLYGHPGIKKTMELIQRNYTFTGIKEAVTTYIRKCADCQRNKHATHLKYGEMQNIKIPTAPWEDIAMDFVTGIPKSKDPVTGIKYDSILVIVCRLTKYIELIPCMKTTTAKELAFLILDRLIRHHGIPKTIISDRDKLFTSNYWTTLMALIGTKRKLSTAYHPQTDGQTERTNQTMETYLRIYCNDQKNNWILLLPMAQLAYNNKVSAATGQTPFYANHGRHPHLFDQAIHTNIQAQEAIDMAENMKKIHEQLRENLEKAQQQASLYTNRKRKTAPLLEKGDKAYLLTKNLRTQRKKHKKLDHVKVGPFFISERISPVNYKLELPSDAKIHPVFHVDRLEPADPETPVETTFYHQPEEETEFEVERILNYDQQQRTYLVKWKGYPHSENTWEPEDHLFNCQERIREFRRRQTRN
jgi:Reverse transcriptase (RNA-dependent DNA polymerase)/RNase H-like domain found in reverse transcriptase/Integrase zinc binding domain/Chromo (CHRromatin Organisation MOdifier) domain/gag-polyprotein putative aspartyl protease